MGYRNQNRKSNGEWDKDDRGVNQPTQADNAAKVDSEDPNPLESLDVEKLNEGANFVRLASEVGPELAGRILTAKTMDAFNADRQPIDDISSLVDVVPEGTSALEYLLGGARETLGEGHEVERDARSGILYLSLHDYLAPRLKYLPEVDRHFQEWAIREYYDGTDYPNGLDMRGANEFFIKVLGVPEMYVHTHNTYDYEGCLLDSDIQFTTTENKIGGSTLVLLQHHLGGSPLGGYTRPMVFASRTYEPFDHEVGDAIADCSAGSHFVMLRGGSVSCSTISKGGFSLGEEDPYRFDDMIAVNPETGKEDFCCVGCKNEGKFTRTTFFWSDSGL